MKENSKAIVVLTMNTLAFSICFAAWLCYSVLIAYLVTTGEFQWNAGQIGTLIAIPILTGSLLRFPIGIFTDRFGGRSVYVALMLLSAIPMYLVSSAQNFYHFFWAGLGFGLAGASFAVGFGYTSVWFSKERQGTALGIFGVGNAGAAFTTLFAPVLLERLDSWRTLPRLYAASLVVMALLFLILTPSKKAHRGNVKSIWSKLSPLKTIRVWRFGLYYALVFGGFVGLASWLPIYYINVYELSLVQAGLLVTLFVLPTGVIRAAGGWMSDRWGARKVMYGALSMCLVVSAFLMIPKVDIITTGEGIRSPVGTKENKAVVTRVSSGEIELQYEKLNGEKAVYLQPVTARKDHVHRWNEAKVRVGDEVMKGELIARGFTRLFFEMRCPLFAFLVLILGLSMGIGSSAVYRHIPDYFPNEVGVVGGLVGVLGGLGGFFGPKIFGILLQWTGVWTTSWMFLAVLTVICLVWMHIVIKRMMLPRSPAIVLAVEER